MNKKYLMLLILVIFTVSAMLGGCGGKKVERIYGLEPEGVVTTAFTAAKEQRFSHAAAYVSPASLTNTKAVSSLLAGMSSNAIKTSNLLSVKKVAEQGDYAAVVVTIQQANTFKMSFRAIGLERVDGEWYIVANDQILQNAKYRVLAQLLSNI